MEFNKLEPMEFNKLEPMESQNIDTETAKIYHINVSYLASGPWEKSTWDEGYYALIKTNDLQKLIDTSKNMQWKYTTEGGKGKACRVTIASYKYIGVIEDDTAKHSEDYHEVTILYQAEHAPSQKQQIDVYSTRKEIYRDSVLFALDCYIDEVDSDSDYGTLSPQSL